MGTYPLEVRSYLFPIINTISHLYVIDSQSPLLKERSGVVAAVDRGSIAPINPGAASPVQSSVAESKKRKFDDLQLDEGIGKCSPFH